MSNVRKRQRRARERRRRRLYPRKPTGGLFDEWLNKSMQVGDEVVAPYFAGGDVGFRRPYVPFFGVDRTVVPRRLEGILYNDASLFVAMPKVREVPTPMFPVVSLGEVSS